MPENFRIEIVCSRPVWQAHCLFLAAVEPSTMIDCSALSHDDQHLPRLVLYLHFQYPYTRPWP
jgi:hypothetical protein